MPDFDAITVALAARYAPGVVTPPATYTNIRRSTADLPNKLTVLPAVLVFPDSGGFATGQGTRNGVHSFLVRFYFQQSIDLTRELPALRKWATVLVDQLRLTTALAGTVTIARTMSWRAGLLPYAGKTYSGLELGVEIVTNEPWAAA